MDRGGMIAFLLSAAFCLSSASERMLHARPLWTLNLYTFLESGPFLADLTRNGRMEFALSTQSDRLHAVNADGRCAGTHCIRTKSRARPLVLDADGDGDMEIPITAYNQHVYLFDHNGNLTDDLRLCGWINGSSVAMDDGALRVTAALMAHHVRFSQAAPNEDCGIDPGAQGRRIHRTVQRLERTPVFDRNKADV